MTKTTPKLGKKGGPKKVADVFKEIRKAPISKEVFEIVDEHNKKNNPGAPKKSAKPPSDLEI